MPSRLFKEAAALKIHGEALGILTPTDPHFHPFAARGVLDGLAVQTFDGAGAGTQKDLVMFNGTRTPGAPADFDLHETLSYTVNPDCTGELRITYSNGTRITTKIVILDQGNEMFSVVSTQHVGVGPTALDGTPCDSGCDVAVQTSTSSVRVDAERGRERER